MGAKTAERGLPGPLAGGPPIPQPGIVERGRRAGLRHLRGRQPRRPVAVERRRPGPGLDAGLGRQPGPVGSHRPARQPAGPGRGPLRGAVDLAGPRDHRRAEPRSSIRSRPTWPRPSAGSSTSTPVVSGTGITVYANAAWIPAAGPGRPAGRPSPPPRPDRRPPVVRVRSPGAPIVRGAGRCFPGPAAATSYRGPLAGGTVFTRPGPGRPVEPGRTERVDRGRGRPRSDGPGSTR